MSFLGAAVRAAAKAAKKKKKAKKEMGIRKELEREGLKMRSGGLVTKNYVNPVTIVDHLKKKK